MMDSCYRYFNRRSSSVQKQRCAKNTLSIIAVPNSGEHFTTQPPPPSAFFIIVNLNSEFARSLVASSKYDPAYWNLRGKKHASNFWFLLLLLLLWHLSSFYYYYGLLVCCSFFINKFIIVVFILATTTIVTIAKYKWIHYELCIVVVVFYNSILYKINCL